MKQTSLLLLTFLLPFFLSAQYDNEKEIRMRERVKGLSTSACHGNDGLGSCLTFRHEYDERGNETLDHLTRTSSWWEKTYDEHDNMIQRITRVDDGDLQEYYGYRYTYDEWGNMTSQTDIVKGDSTIYRNVYDPKVRGRLLKVYSLPAEPGKSMYPDQYSLTWYEYGKGDEWTTMRVYQYGTDELDSALTKEPAEYEKRTFDKQGRIVHRTQRRWEKTTEHTYEYDANGRLIAENLYYMDPCFSLDGQYRFEYTYGANGLVQSAVMYDSTGAFESNWSYHYSFYP